jgi:hypothetical protein
MRHPSKAVADIMRHRGPETRIGVLGVLCSVLLVASTCAYPVIVVVSTLHPPAEAAVAAAAETEHQNRIHVSTTTQGEQSACPVLCR